MHRWRLAPSIPACQQGHQGGPACGKWRHLPSLTFRRGRGQPGHRHGLPPHGVSGWPGELWGAGMAGRVPAHRVQAQCREELGGCIGEGSSWKERGDGAIGETGQEVEPGLEQGVWGTACAPAAVLGDRRSRQGALCCSPARPGAFLNFGFSAQFRFGGVGSLFLTHHLPDPTPDRTTCPPCGNKILLRGGGGTHKSKGVTCGSSCLRCQCQQQPCPHFHSWARGWAGMLPPSEMGFGGHTMSL